MAIHLSAQVDPHGTPLNWQKKNLNLDALPVINLGNLEMKTILKQDKETATTNEASFRFGIEKNTNIDLFEKGEQSVLKNGSTVWRLGIHGKDATSLSFIFNEWYLPEGSELTIWNKERTQYLGVYNSTSNKSYGTLATSILESDVVYIEYVQPASITGNAKVNIGTVVHGYRKIQYQKKGFGMSGSCQVNINCPEGSSFQNESRGITMIIDGGSRICTGSLINNTNNDAKPYLLTAEHCLPPNRDINSWVFVFNYEAPGCNNVDGPLNMSISGANIVVESDVSDVALLELSANVPASYNPYFNGWNRSSNPATRATAIHHPSGDIKKISIDNDPPVKGFNAAFLPGQSGVPIPDGLEVEFSNNSNFWLVEWDTGVTDGGSSGSPLFDQNRRIIGQQFGGFSGCGSTSTVFSSFDEFGAFDVSWPLVQQFLAPNSNPQTLNGFDPNGNTGGGGGDACTTTNVNFNNFEKGFGIWRDGGSDCSRSRGATFRRGSYSVRLRDNTNSSTTTTRDLRLRDFESITVSYRYLGRDMEKGEDFFLQVRTSNNSGFRTVQRQVSGTDFVNERVVNRTVTIDGPFTNRTRLRFRCDASNNNDRVFIDNVRITGCRSNSSSLTSGTSSDLITIDESFVDDLNGFEVEIYPNPASSELFVNFPLKNKEQGTVNIFDVNGKLIQQRSLSGDGRNELKIETLDFEPGIYFLNAQSSSTKVTKRFIIQR